MSMPLFVGRAQELDWLADRLSTAIASKPSIVVVDGPPGIGKSALVSAFLDGLRDVRTLRASGDESETFLPFGVVHQLLGISGTAWEDPFAAGAAVLQDLDRLGDLRATVLVVDDAHLADAASLGALTFSLRRLAADPVLAIFVTRDDQVSRLPAGLLRLADAGGDRLHVHGLSETEVAELIQARGLGEPTGAATARLRRHTDGSPLYVRALLDELPVETLLTAEPLPAPPSYALLFTSALVTHSEPAQRLARAAALLPDGSPLDLVAAVAEVADPRQALEELSRSPAVLTCVESERGWTVGFPHPLVRAAVYDDLGPHARAVLHARAGGLLTGDVALRHLVAASDGSDDELAGRLVAAATANLARGDVHTAAELTLKASRVGAPGTTSDERILDAVNLLLIDGDLASTKALAEELADTPPTARRVYLQARLAWFAGEPDAAESLATEAWSRGDQLSPDHRGSLAAILSQLHNMRADGAGAAEWASQAIALGLPPDLADSTNAARAFGLAMVGRIDEALGVLESVPSDPTLVRGYSHQLTTRGALRVATDDLVGARADLATVCNASNAEVSPQRLLAMGALAEVEFRLGSWDASLAAAEHALSLAEDTEQVWVQGYLHTAAVLVCAARGDWVHADQHLAAARNLAEQLGDLATFAVCENASVHIAWCRSDPDEVVARSALLVSLGGGPTHEPGLMQWPVQYVSALVELGRLDEAEPHIAEFEALARERGCDSRLAGLARVRGELATARRDHQAARASFGAALELDRGGVSVLDAALLQAAFGRFLRRRGEKGAAVQRLTEARTRLNALGARPFVARVEDELAACGVAPTKRTLQLPAALTPQERTIATLVCQGMTNPEVAQRLVLSVKTVSYHLGNVYTKLNVHSRTQLAGAWTPDAP
jgi:DNA-binding CsgD family transcriptional regulator